MLRDSEKIPKLKKRSLIALCAVGIHLAIGSVYAYSVITVPLALSHNWTKSDITFAFSLAIFFLGFSAATAGQKVEKLGPSKSAFIAGLFYSIGTLFSGIAIYYNSLVFFTLSYGIICGIGLGIGYIAPVSTLVKWFPDKRGLATGIAIMGFGFSSLIFAPFMAKLFIIMPVYKAFFVLAAIYFILISLSASYISPPPKDFSPPKTKNKTTKKAIQLAQCTVQEAVKTKRFYFIWFMIFININGGIALIAVASPMAQSLLGIDQMGAATMVGFMGLFNGIGRILWSSVSDYIGRSKTYMLFFLIQIFAFILLAKTNNPLIFQATLYLILSCYGGGFAALPAFLCDLFGVRQLGAIHGMTLTAWAIAGLTGPMLVSRILDVSNSYSLTLYLFAGFFFIAFILSFFMLKEYKRLEKSLPNS